MYPRKDPLYRNIGLHYLSANTVNANYCPIWLELESKSVGKSSG